METEGANAPLKERRAGRPARSRVLTDRRLRQVEWWGEGREGVGHRGGLVASAMLLHGPAQPAAVQTLAVANAPLPPIHAAVRSSPGGNDAKHQVAVGGQRRQAACPQRGVHG